MVLFLLICIPEHHNTPQTTNQKWPVSLQIKFFVPTANNLVGRPMSSEGDVKAQPGHTGGIIAVRLNMRFSVSAK